MNKLVLGIIALAVTTQAWAALPPYAQRNQELGSILAFPHLSKVVANAVRSGGSGVIDRIEATKFTTGPKAGTLVYRVKSGICALTVKVVYESGKTVAPGPAKFHLEAAKSMFCSEDIDELPPGFGEGIFDDLFD